MRNTKTLKFEGREESVTVYELTVKQIIDLVQGDLFGDTALENLKTTLDKEFLPMCTNLRYDDLIIFPPSKLEEIYLAFKEVNATFFVVAQKLGLTKAMEEAWEEIKKAMLEDFSKQSVVLSKLVTPES